VLPAKDKYQSLHVPQDQEEWGDPLPKKEKLM
jgi:hypothetical protein